MIHFYVGKPRNGKSLRVMMKIIEVLTTTEQHIVTNMVLRHEILQDYLDEKGHSVHVLNRITQIDDDQTRNFWLYRAGEFILEKPDDYDDKKNPENISYKVLFEDPIWRIGNKLNNPDGSPSNFKGTCYVIDEVQNLWPARGWQGTGHHISFYLSQHGKLGDTVYFITQNIKNVDRLLYSLAQDFTYCRNHRLEKHGKFKGDNKFSAKTYPGPVTDGNEVTLNTEEFKLDLQIAACYDTSAGVGMPGGGTADAGFRSKGIPLTFVWVGLAAVLLLCFIFFQTVIPMMTNKFIAPAIDGKNTKNKTNNILLPSDTKNTREQNPINQFPTQLPANVQERPWVSAVWIEIKNGLPLVHADLTDGASIPPSWITGYNLNDYPQGWVEARGVRYFFRNRADSSLAALALLTKSQVAQNVDSHLNENEKK